MPLGEREGGENGTCAHTYSKSSDGKCEDGRFAGNRAKLDAPAGEVYKANEAE